MFAAVAVVPGWAWSSPATAATRAVSTPAGAAGPSPTVAAQVELPRTEAPGDELGVEPPQGDPPQGESSSMDAPVEAANTQEHVPVPPVDPSGETVARPNSDTPPPVAASPLPDASPAPTSEPSTPPPAPPARERPPAVAESHAPLRDARSGSTSEIVRFHHRLGEGLSFASRDGRFSLQLRARVQLRYDLEHPNVAGESTEHLMQVRRMRLQLRGNVFAQHVKYYLQLGFSAQDMSSGLPSDPAIRRNPVRDARIELDRLRDFTVWAGQFKVPFNRQRVISSSNMNLVDRSSVNGEFTLDRDLGVQVLSKDLGGLDKLGYNVGVFLGEGRNAYNPRDLGLLYVGRLEVLPFGQFDDYTDGDLGRTKTPKLSIGAAYAYQDRAQAARGVIGDPLADGGTTNYHHFTADMMFKWAGVSLHSAFFLRRGAGRRSGGALDEMGVPIPTVAARQGLGWYGQLGWVVPKIPLELVGRYGLIRNLQGNQSSLGDSEEVGGGINWYFVGHDLKLQVDYFRLWNDDLGATFGERARHGTDRIRVQGQLYF